MINSFTLISKLTALFLFLSLVTCAQVNIPDGFSEVIESPSNGKKMEQVFLNFDTDNIIDTVLLVENTSEHSKYKVLLYLSSQNKTFEIVLISLNEMSIYPVQIKARKNVIEFGYYEDGTANFGRFIKLRYNALKNQIQIIGYDVSYKSSPTEYISKSYNLITAKYIVKRTYYDDNKIVKVQEFTGTNDFFKNIVFLENLNEETIINLDDVGSPYE